jgi:hypothetical protein
VEADLNILPAARNGHHSLGWSDWADRGQHTYTLVHFPHRIELSDAKKVLNMVLPRGAAFASYRELLTYLSVVKIWKRCSIIALGSRRRYVEGPDLELPSFPTFTASLPIGHQTKLDWSIGWYGFEKGEPQVFDHGRWWFLVRLPTTPSS